MGKVKELQLDTIEKQQLHGIKNSSIKKNKDSKFKHAPKGKATLINDLKSQGNYTPSQKGSTNAKNQNQNLLKKQTSNSNVKQSKQGSANGKQNFPSKGQKLNKTKINLKKMEEQFDDSSSDIDEGIVPQEDVSLNKTDETFEEDSDTDTPDIFGKSLADESDEDDEDFEEEDEDEAGAEDEDEEEEDDDSDEQEAVQHKRIKMFKGLQSEAMNDDEEGQEEDDDDDDDDDEDDDDDDDDSLLNDETLGAMALAESDEDDDDDNDEDEEDDDDDDDEDEDENNYKKQLNVKILGEVDSSVMESDEENEDEDDDDEEEEEEEDDDSDDDNVGELGLKALLGKNIADDDDDEDFNEEDEDDEDDDISSEDEDDEENDNAITKAYIMKKEKVVTKKKADEAPNKKDVSKGNTKVEKETEQEDVERRLVFVNNIPKGTPINNIKILFGQYGVVKNVDYPLSDCSRNIGKKPKKMAAAGTEVQPRATTVVGNILYKTEESALKAAKELNGTKLNGNYLTVLTALEAKQDLLEAKTVFLTNLKRGIEENEIWKTFGKCGHIKRLRLIRDSRTGLTKGYGYLSFDSKDAVQLALKLNGAEIKGRPLKVLPFRDSKKVYVNKSNKEDEKQGTKRFLSHKDDNKPSKKFKNSSQEPVSYNAEHERNVKHMKQQGDNKETKAFQGQKVQLKSKKKNKFDKKKKKMAEKLTAKSAKV